MTGWVSPAMKQDEFEKLMAIEPGIPSYIRGAIATWVAGGGDSRYGYDAGTFTSLGLAFKRVLPTSYERFVAFLQAQEDDILVSMLDWMLFHGTAAIAANWEELAHMLDTGHAEWTVTDVEWMKPRMTKRIPEGVEDAYRDIVSKTAAAGGLLAQAFNAVYGAVQNSNDSYGLSVKAVETIACPKFLPSNGRATLGAVIAHLSNKEVTLPLRAGNAPDKDLIIAMMRKLWEGGERHGSETYEHVTVPGAKAALALAFSLVSMLHEDVIEVS